MQVKDHEEVMHVLVGDASNQAAIIHVGVICERIAPSTVMEGFDRSNEKGSLAR